jgi:sensor histidine kinase YesM
MKRPSRFWVIYVTAWFPYAGSYVVIFIQEGSSIGSAIYNALSNIIPAVLLGVGVVWLCRRLTWSLYRRLWFFPLQIVLAILYSLLWVCMVSAIFTLWTTIQTGHWTVVFLRSYALQWELFSGLMIYATLASATYVMEITDDFRQEERRAKEMELRTARAEALQTQTELAALRAKLNPHFLFNTLHTLMALVRDDRAGAEVAIEHFSSMLRYILRQEADDRTGGAESRDTTFQNEWHFVKDYLSLEQLRLGNRLVVKTKIDPVAFGALLPPLTLQPLVENAIKHGIAPRASGGKIVIAASLKDSDLIVDVSDDGCGATRDQLSESSGLGLRLIAKTLNTQYDGNAELDIKTSPQQGFNVRLRIPQNNGVAALIAKNIASETNEDL